MQTKFRAAVGAAMIALVFTAACGDDDTSTAVPPSTASTVPDAPALEVDWERREVAGTSGSDVDVDFCEGDGPFLCFRRDGEVIGGMELMNFDATTFDVIEATRAGGGNDMDALTAVADDFVAVFEEDRAEGCGADYDVVPIDPEVAEVAGTPGLRYGFRGEVDGDTKELVIVHATIDGDTLWLFNASGLSEDGCLPREGEFDVEGLESVRELVAVVVAASTLPPPSS